MTRTTAREIAVQLIYSISLSEHDVETALEDFFDDEYFNSLAAEDELFEYYPNK